MCVVLQDVPTHHTVWMLQPSALHCSTGTHRLWTPPTSAGASSLQLPAHLPDHVCIPAGLRCQAQQGHAMSAVQRQMPEQREVLQIYAAWVVARCSGADSCHMHQTVISRLPGGMPIGRLHLQGCAASAVQAEGRLQAAAARGLPRLRRKRGRPGTGGGSAAPGAPSAGEPGGLPGGQAAAGGQVCWACRESVGVRV